MSDMERDKNERLNARKIEEEEMKRELMNIGIYEPGITYNQMKQILGFLNEFKNTSNEHINEFKNTSNINNRNTQKETQYSDNECLSETKSDVNTLQECTESSKSSYVYKVNRTSPTVHSEYKSIHYSSSPESSLLYEVQNPIYRHKSSDSDELTEKQHENTNSIMHSTNRFHSLRSGSENSQITTSEKKQGQDTQDIEFMQKLERWRLNPLDICINENDVPLQQPCRPLARERVPFAYCKETSTSEQHDQVVYAMSQHLKEMAKLQCAWHLSANSVFQWGSPIQVGTANDSLDRKLLTDFKTEEIKTECTYRDNHERISKRKASFLIANLNNETSSEDECDNQYDFARVKKKKIQSNSKSNNMEHRAAYQHANHEKTISNVVIHQEYSPNHNNNDVNLEDEHTESLYAKIKADEENERLSPELTTYSKRIVPFNPKACLSLPRQKRENAISKSSPKMRRIDRSKDADQEKQKKNDIMTNNEIRQTLEEDWNNEQEEEATVTKNMEIRPLSISKEMQSRLRKKQLSFNNTETLREIKAAMKERNSNRERDKKKLLKIHEEGKKKEELSRLDERNGNWEHQLLSDDENEEMDQETDVQNSKQSVNISISSDNIYCPICNKPFSHNEIEDHAADCEQFEANEEREDSDADQLECNICNNYKTSNGMDYEQHVHQCIDNNYDRLDKNSHLHESKASDSASTSFKNFKPISEQKNSEIDYLGQFLCDSRTKYNTGRKRKR